MPREGQYQAYLVRKIKEILPGAVVLKNDASYLQGVPDLLVLFDNRWAMLEVKPNRTAHVQPNQQFWVQEFNNMSFAAFIFPENEEEVLNALQRSLKARRSTRIS